MKTEVLNVTGMTCGGCATSVKRALGALPGITGVEVWLPKNQVEVQFDEGKVKIEQMRTTLQGAGYDVAAAATNAEKRHGTCCS